MRFITLGLGLSLALQVSCTESELGRSDASVEPILRADAEPLVKDAAPALDGGREEIDATPADLGADAEAIVDLGVDAVALADLGADVEPAVDLGTDAAEPPADLGTDAADPCEGVDCGAHGGCDAGACQCAEGYDGEACEVCAEGYNGFPECQLDPCADLECAEPWFCVDGRCVECDPVIFCGRPNASCTPDGFCACDEGFAGDDCDACAEGYTGYPDCYADACAGVTCEGGTFCAEGRCVECDATHACDERATCTDGACACLEGFTGDDCEACAEGYINFPDCQPDLCLGVICEAPMRCIEGLCLECSEDEHCSDPESPRCHLEIHVCVDCLEDVDCAGPTPICDPSISMCVGCLEDVHCAEPTPVCDPSTGTCLGCLEDAHCAEPTPVCDPSTGTCLGCLEDAHCADPTPVCDPSTSTCLGCFEDAHCTESAPYCLDAACVACRDDADPAPEGLCDVGVCAATPEAACVDHAWTCDGPSYEPVEETCDGFDNDCDGEVDEGCERCSIDIDRVRTQLYSKWDIDFDYDCTAYLTTLVSGADYVDVVPSEPEAPEARYLGNANQNMGFALVDPDPTQRRVVVVYACCPSCGCQARNGLTLLYQCAPEEPDCGCVGQANCPGFLNEPFIATGASNTRVSNNAYAISTPTGLAVGPGNSYFVGNFAPLGCSNDAGAIICDPSAPEAWCEVGLPHHCPPTEMGRLVQFTLPSADAPARWRAVAVFEGEQIIGLASGRDGSVLVGTSVDANTGRLYRVDPYTGEAALWDEVAGAVFSITQDRLRGDWYVERLAEPKIVRFSEGGVPQALPASIPGALSGKGTLQIGPDDQLYRLQGTVGRAAILDRYPLAL